MLANLLQSRKAVAIDQAAAILAKAEKRRTTALAHLERCEREFASELLDGVLNVDEAGAFKTKKALDAARTEDSTAAQILEAAREIHSKALDADQAAQRLAQIAAIADHLAQRDAAATALGAAITEACSQWRALQEHSANALSIGPPLPRAGLVEFAELKHAVERELFRLGGDPEIGSAHSFPGVKAPDFQTLNNPKANPPLALVMSEATAHILAALKGGRDA